MVEHRKHERRKEGRDDLDHSRNGGKYAEKERYREGRYPEDSRERYEYESKRRKEKKRRSRDRSWDRSEQR